MLAWFGSRKRGFGSIGAGFLDAKEKSRQNFPATQSQLGIGPLPVKRFRAAAPPVASFSYSQLFDRSSVAPAYKPSTVVPAPPLPTQTAAAATPVPAPRPLAPTRQPQQTGNYLSRVSQSIEARVASFHAHRALEKEKERVAQLAARQANDAARYVEDMRRVARLKEAVIAMEPRRAALAEQVEAVEAQRASVAECAARLKRDLDEAETTVDTLTESVTAAEADADNADVDALNTLAASAEAALNAARADVQQTVSTARSAAQTARALSDELGTLLWRFEDDESAELLRTHHREQHAAAAPLVEQAGRCVTELRKHADQAKRLNVPLADLNAALEVAREILDSGIFTPALNPPGTRVIGRPALTAAEEAQVDAALAAGDDDEQLVEFENIPVTRSDMRTLHRQNWLNDEVINLFLKLMTAREASKTDDLPKCYFAQTNFYTKLAESGKGYCYKDVRRWTKKVDVFTKDMIIFPIHCHGNHWTLAVINLIAKRFEYYDSLRGHAGNVLTHLRQWLMDEHEAKKSAPYDTSGFTSVTWPEGTTPQQRNGSDCGVFMTQTADYLARDAKLDFKQEHMAYFRRRMILEILRTQLLP